MLGGTGTGKTTYLIGMYAELSAGIDNYFMSADHDTDIDLARAWDALVDDGILPRATNESKAYEFTFRYGFDPLLMLDWVDYRGGAMSETTDSPGTAALITRLGESDSLYLTLDGALLASVLAGEARGEQRLRSVVGRYSAILGRVGDERRENDLVPPSVVVLVTKGDLMRDRLAGTGEERQARITRWAVDLFGQVFRPDWDSAVCVVSLGRLGESVESRIDPRRVEPAGIHKPMIFSLYSFYRRAARAFEAEAARVRGIHGRGLSELEQMRSRVMTRFLGHQKVSELGQAVEQASQYVYEMESLAHECLSRTSVLEGELLDVPTFIDGQWMNGGQ